MKKINSILVLLSLVGIITTSCMKDNDLPNPTNQKQLNTPTAEILKKHKSAENLTAAVLPGGGFEGIYQLTSNVGHTSADCGGKCRYMNGVYYHANCQGFGNACTLRASVSVDFIPSTHKYIGKGLNDYEPTDETSFLMPDRSFKVEDKNNDDGYIWLNIPAQILLRNPVSHQFIYNDITFSETQLYPNL
ncbi:MAG: hypothetical protein NTZ33_03220 [Bacteroidetes bacterium]|nr:hypothetical protein [Bacteroidota bacterium]